MASKLKLGAKKKRKKRERGYKVNWYRFILQCYSAGWITWYQSLILLAQERSDLQGEVHSDNDYILPNTVSVLQFIDCLHRFTEMPTYTNDQRDVSSLSLWLCEATCFWSCIVLEKCSKCGINVEREFFQMIFKTLANISPCDRDTSECC